MLQRKEHHQTDNDEWFRQRDASQSNVVRYPARKKDSAQRILIVNGHPDPRPTRFCAALCEAYRAGARSGGWETRQLALGSLAISTMAPAEASGICETSDDLTSAFELLRWANQLVVVFPLWLNAPPAPLRELFKQMVKRDTAAGEGFSAIGRSARTARLVITMELPAFAHRLLFRADANIQDATNPLHLSGTKVCETTFVGSVDVISPEQRMVWLQTVRKFGVNGF